ncbi:helix-turn-helix transcriptional regulator [Bradyrhizobium diazoefficiens]|nr:helix-turn-helix transcriptional regulator [Bradyrhizobium diazoefficiens]
MSLESVGHQVGVSSETIRRLEERDTWLDPDRAAQIARALGVPMEVLGFSYAPDSYGWAAKALSIVGSVADDKVKFHTSGRRVAGSSRLPVGSVGLDITQGKMRGWLLVYREDGIEPMTSDVLARQGFKENFLSHLADGTTRWGQITPAAKHDLYHITSRNMDPLNDVQIEWVAQIVGFEAAPFELPAPEQLDNVTYGRKKK